MDWIEHLKEYRDSVTAHLKNNHDTIDVVDQVRILDAVQHATDLIDAEEYEEEEEEDSPHARGTVRRSCGERSVLRLTGRAIYAVGMERSPGHCLAPALLTRPSDGDVHGFPARAGIDQVALQRGGGDLSDPIQLPFGVIRINREVVQHAGGQTGRRRR